MDAGGFDERFCTYLEDVDLALRLRLAGWRCRYEPVVARHAGEGSLGASSRSRSHYWVERNTAAAGRQGVPAALAALGGLPPARLGLARAAQRPAARPPARRAAALPLLPAILRERRALRASARVPLDEVVPARPIRGRRARAATARVTPRRAEMSALFVSYSGRFGGAERLLLDCAAALDGERVLACPRGRARRGRAARPACAWCRCASTRSSCAARRGRARSPRCGWAPTGCEARRLVRDLRPGPAPGMGHALRDRPGRGRCGARPPRTVFQHNDLLPAPAVARLVRAAAARYDRVVALSGADRARPGPRRRARRARLARLPPGRGPGALPGPAAAGAARTGAACWARSWTGSAPTSRSRRWRSRPASCPGCGCGWPGRRSTQRGEELLARPARARRAARPRRARGAVAGPPTPPRRCADATCLLHCADSEPFGLVRARGARLGPARGRARLGRAGRAARRRRGQALPARRRGRRGRTGSSRCWATPSSRPGSAPQGRRRAEARHGLDDAGARWREAVAPPAPAAGSARGEGLALVTVTHDSERELDALLRSVRRATCRARRVVVVDSGSSDGSVAVARAARRAGRACSSWTTNVGFGTAHATAALEAVTRAGGGGGEPRRGAARRLAGRAGGRGGALDRPERIAGAARAAARRRAPGLRAPAAGDRGRPRALAGAPDALPGRSAPAGALALAADRGAWAGRWAAASWRAPRRSAGSARSTSGSSSTPRTSTSGCAPAPPGSRPGSGPPRGCSTSAPTAPAARSAASPSSCSRTSAAR